MPCIRPQRLTGTAPINSSDYLNAEQQRVIEAAIRLRLRGDELPGAALDDAVLGPRLAVEARREKALYAICAQFIVDWAAARRVPRKRTSKRCSNTLTIARRKHVISRRTTGNAA
jgi:hypothetical protein